MEKMPQSNEKTDVEKIISTVKTRIDTSTVLDFLQAEIHPNITELHLIKGGENSQAFWYSLDNKDYVIKINTDKFMLEEDAYAAEHFSSESTPIPKTIAIGELENGYHYYIAEKASWKTLHEYIDNIKTLFPELLKTLTSIHATDISKTTGYGFIDKDGNGIYKTHTDFLLSVFQDKWLNWDELLKGDIAKQEDYDYCKKHIEQLLQCIPNHRYLTHGDFSFDNILSDGEKITGLVDWSNSYGDYLYDVAWVDFWHEDLWFKDYYKKQQQENIKNFEERILCHKFRIAANALGFYAKSHQTKNYQFIQKKLTKLM